MIQQTLICGYMTFLLLNCFSSDGSESPVTSYASSKKRSSYAWQLSQKHHSFMWPINYFRVSQASSCNSWSQITLRVLYLLPIRALNPSYSSSKKRSSCLLNTTVYLPIFWWWKLPVRAEPILPGGLKVLYSLHHYRSPLGIVSKGSQPFFGLSCMKGR